MTALLDPERIARLRQKQEVAFTPVFLHRPLAILFLIPTADIPWITPNRLTTVNIFMRLVTAALIWPEALGGLPQSSATLWTAIFLWHAGATLDAADGALARYRGKGSAFGRFYDKISDRLITLVLMTALAARAFVVEGEILYVFAAMIYVALMSACSVAKWIELGLEAEQKEASKAEDPGEVEAPKRTIGDWLRYLMVSASHAVAVTEMDLPLWGSIAILIGHEDWLLLYLGAYAIPYTLIAIGSRAYRIHRSDHG